jgi:hypothetical protein
MGEKRRRGDEPIFWLVPKEEKEQKETGICVWLWVLSVILLDEGKKGKRTITMGINVKSSIDPLSFSVVLWRVVA